LEQAPDSYAFVKCAEKEGSFARPQSTWIPLTDGPVRRTYQLVPDRDVNGAGLVYFANYPLFLDICERDVLVSGSLPLTGALVDNRTLVHRRSAYLNNASAHDTLLVDVEPWIELPPVRLADGAERFIKLHINYRMYRQSDQRLMMVSSAEKVIMDATVDDLPFITRAPLQTLQRPRA
jgi:hypothetical protein